MSDMFGIGGIAQGVGTLGAAAIQAYTASSIAKEQRNAVTQARNFVFNNLNPSVISRQATMADAMRAKQRLALQANVDPALAQIRTNAQNQLLAQSGEIGQGVEQQLAKIAAANALESNQQTTDLKTRLIDSALAELDAGASLPADVQAELVKAGLERSGMVSGNTNPTGVGGTIARQVLGSGALALKQQRLANVQNLTGTAANLETQRQQILASLFPSLNAMKLQNIQATAGVLNQSNAMVPEAGLGGTDIANIWLARTGAVNQLNQSAADIASRNTGAQGQIWSNAVGQLGQQISNAFPVKTAETLPQRQSANLDYIYAAGL